MIILQDVHFTELESLLCFVYKGEVNIEQDNLPALLRAAETLQIRGLSGASEQVKEKVFTISICHTTYKSQSSSVGIETRLCAGQLGFDFPAGQDFSFHHNIETSSEAHLASYSVSTNGYSAFCPYVIIFSALQ